MSTTPKPSFGDLIQGTKPVLVDFSAEWCGPCKAMPPILKQVKDKLGDRITILKLDIDRNPQIAASYQIQSVPTLLLFRSGQVKWRQSGVIPAEQLAPILDGMLRQP
jgi:thioredoxin 1